MSDWPSPCAAYDAAAVVFLVDGGRPEWRETPERVHITSELADDQAAGEFIRTAYRLSPGCRDDLLHGDLIATRADA